MKAYQRKHYKKNCVNNFNCSQSVTKIYLETSTEKCTPLPSQPLFNFKDRPIKAFPVLLLIIYDWHGILKMKCRHLFIYSHFTNTWVYTTGMWFWNFFSCRWILCCITVMSMHSITCIQSQWAERIYGDRLSVCLPLWTLEGSWYTWYLQLSAITSCLISDTLIIHKYLRQVELRIVSNCKTHDKSLIHNS